MNEESRVADRLVIICVVFLSLNVLGLFWFSAGMSRMTATLAKLRVTQESPPDPVAAQITWPNDANSASEHFPSVTGLKVPGVSNPSFCAADEVNIAETTRIIGIDVNGESRAYMIDAFKAPENVKAPEDLAVHIVNDIVGDEPIVVTHCDRTHSTRVLTTFGTGLQSSETADVCVGGFEAEMLLSIGNSVFTHHSAELPLADVPYTNTTWQEWKEIHPETLIYIGKPCDSRS